jgi:chemotaxis protein CheD
MHRHYNSRFAKEIAILHPGEYFATGEDMLISTVLGSCISVALFDRRNAWSGMNHFMLPGSVDRKKDVVATDTGKYGMYAMELLINDMMKMGSRRGDLVAKVFGGGHVLRSTVSGGGTVPQSNIKFAFEYLELERIPIESSDVGGTIARKIFLFPRTFRVLLKRITGNLIVDVEREEEQYLEKIQKETGKGGEVTLF